MKKRAFEIVKKKNLCSYMNDTKWSELRNAMMNELPFPPFYVFKTLFEDECPDEIYIYSDSSLCGDWGESFAFGGYYNGGFAFEWLKIRPRVLKHRGMLIEPEVLDEGPELEEILRKYAIPFEKSGEVYCIYGYK